MLHNLRLGQLTLALVFAVGWVRPQPPTTAKPAEAAGQRLDYVIINVNGEPRLVRSGEELAVVRGDKLEVKEAALVNKADKVREVNVLGYTSGHGGGDKARPFTTADLKAKWSEDGKGSVFAVVATSKNLLHGSVYLRLIEPVLRYAELSVNGKKLVLRDGEQVTASASDMVKVEKVVTNLDSDAGVIFQMVPVGPAARAGSPTTAGDYEIRFLRGEAPFAAIPLKVVAPSPPGQGDVR